MINLGELEIGLWQNGYKTRVDNAVELAITDDYEQLGVGLP
jgi:hypothetical protein